MSNRPDPRDFAATQVLPENGAASPAALPERRERGQAEVYEQYVRALDEVPVLRDYVALPSRTLPADFRLGQRRDARREPRPDSYTLRETHAALSAAFYREYLEYLTQPARARDAPKRPTRRRRAKNKKKKRK